MPAPTQKQIDSIASFVEACSELEREAFFGKDEQMQAANSMASKTWILGDRFHFRSALISFRRIWMPSEPSSWVNIIDILKEGGFPSEIDVEARRADVEIQDAIAQTLFLTTMGTRKVIDLWLNTVFAHGGIEGPNKRSEFEAAVTNQGSALFEYSCRQSVRMLGVQFINFSHTAAIPALDHAKAVHGLSPSFKIGAAFGLKNRERTADGHVIIRQASSEFFSEETLANRFSRIVGRYEYDLLKSILENLDVSRTELISAVLRAHSLGTLLTSLDGQLRIQLQRSGDSMEDLGLCIFRIFGPHWVNLYRDNVLETDTTTAGLLEHDFKTFAYQLLRE